MSLDETKRRQVEGFLKKVHAICAVGGVTIAPREKNKAFQRRFNLSHSKQIKIIQALCADSCTAIEPNDNPRYEGSTVYKFKQEFELFSFGEKETVRMYIKMYITKVTYYDEVIVISFHKDRDL